MFQGHVWGQYWRITFLILTYVKLGIRQVTSGRTADVTRSFRHQVIHPMGDTEQHGTQQRMHRKLLSESSREGKRPFSIYVLVVSRWYCSPPQELHNILRYLYKYQTLRDKQSPWSPVTTKHVYFGATWCVHEQIRPLFSALIFCMELVLVTRWEPIASPPPLTWFPHVPQETTTIQLYGHASPCFTRTM